ncbi:Cytochrome P450 monooxygenase gsfF [Fusarium oxysporum f. sp. albedinis]|nr:Cytochrome P450 monooxygenase gsfF [Fusarium oxysporum f. sp. albedinis]
MASTQEGTSKVYAITREGDDFVPENAVWTLHQMWFCTLCFNRTRLEEAYEGVKGRCWEICSIENDGTEVWTYDFSRARNEFWA